MWFRLSVDSKLCLAGEDPEVAGEGIEVMAPGANKVSPVLPRDRAISGREELEKLSQ